MIPVVIVCMNGGIFFIWFRCFFASDMFRDNTFSIVTMLKLDAM